MLPNRDHFVIVKHSRWKYVCSRRRAVVSPRSELASQACIQLPTSAAHPRPPCRLLDDHSTSIAGKVTCPRLSILFSARIPTLAATSRIVSSPRWLRSRSQNDRWGTIGSQHGPRSVKMCRCCKQRMLRHPQIAESFLMDTLCSSYYQEGPSSYRQHSPERRGTLSAQSANTDKPSSS